MLKPKIQSVEKRGGSRRAVKHHPKTSNIINPLEFFKETKSTGLWPKKTNQYRYVICTDFEPDAMIFLELFTAWVKINERAYDSHTSFPIYGFIVGEHQIKRASEFLDIFANILRWNDPDHHLYTGYKSACNRIWIDGTREPNLEKTFKSEFIKDEPQSDSQNTDLFVDHLEEFMQVKPTNLFMIYLKPLQTFNHLKNITGVMSGSLKQLDLLNRTLDDAPLVYVINEDKTMCLDDSPRLFNLIDKKGELAEMISQTMYDWNDSLRDKIIDRLTGEPEFAKCDFDSYSSFIKTCGELSVDRKSQLCDLKILELFLKHGSRQFSISNPLMMIAILIANKTLKNAPFYLEPSKFYDDDVEIKRIPTPTSNTHVLISNTTSDKQTKQFLSKILCAAFSITQFTDR